MAREVYMDMRGLDRFRGGLRAGMRMKGRGTRGNPVADGWNQLGRIYLAFIQRRFARYSRGGGDWKKLADSTIKQRRGPKRRRTRSPRASTRTTTRGTATQVTILRDTSTLFNALTVGNPGNRFERIQNGIRVGFGGPSKHPEGGEATIYDIAVAHDEGKGVPERRILVPPDPPISRQMKMALVRGVQRLARRSSI